MTHLVKMLVISNIVLVSCRSSESISSNTSEVSDANVTQSGYWIPYDTVTTFECSTDNNEYLTAATKKKLIIKANTKSASVTKSWNNVVYTAPRAEATHDGEVRYVVEDWDRPGAYNGTPSLTVNILIKQVPLKKHGGNFLYYIGLDALPKDSDKQGLPEYGLETCQKVAR